MKLIVRAVLLITVLFAAYFFSDDLNRALFFDSYGFIESGSKFGVHIGMDTEEAKTVLSTRGFEPEVLSQSDQCAARHYPEDQSVMLFYNKRYGVICLASKNQSTVSIAWSLGELF